MYQGQTILAVIPARGQSKGLPRKNLRALAGQSLLARTIQTAKASDYIDKIIVSSEDAEILTAARAAGADTPFIRPDYLAQDETPGIAPILHALDELPNYDYVVVLQPTSPLRALLDINAGIAMSIKYQSMVVSVCRTQKNPYWLFGMDADFKLSAAMPGALPVRRQDVPVFYALNGAIYVANSHHLRSEQSFLNADTRALVMPVKRSIDIDDEADLQLAEFYLQTAGE